MADDVDSDYTSPGAAQAPMVHNLITGIASLSAEEEHLPASTPNTDQLDTDQASRNPSTTRSSDLLPSTSGHRPAPSTIAHNSASSMHSELEETEQEHSSRLWGQNITATLESDDSDGQDEDVLLAQAVAHRPRYYDSDTEAAWETPSKMGNSIALLAKACGQTKSELQEIWKEKAFQDCWGEFKRHYLDSKREQGGLIKQGAKWQAILPLLRQGESNDAQRYSNPYLDDDAMEEFGDVGWACRLIARLAKWYWARPTGFLHNRHLSQERAWELFYRMKVYLEKESSVSRTKARNAKAAKAQFAKNLKHSAVKGLFGSTGRRAPTVTKKALTKPSPKAPMAQPAAANVDTAEEEDYQLIGELAGDNQLTGELDDIDKEALDQASDAELASKLTGSLLKRTKHNQRSGQEMLAQLKARFEQGDHTLYPPNSSQRYHYRWLAYTDIRNMVLHIGTGLDTFTIDEEGQITDDVFKGDNYDNLQRLQDTPQPSHRRKNGRQENDDDDILPFGKLSQVDKDLLDWVENLMSSVDYQPDDLKGAFRRFHIKPNSWREPRLRGMHKNVSLRWWQLTGAHDIWCKIEKRLMRGVLLADSVGIGKTMLMATVILHGINIRELNIQSDSSNPMPPARPYLLIVPPALVAQMVNELQSFSPRFKILLYKSKGAQDIGSAPTIKDELTKEHTIFDASKDINARTIVITTYQTLAQRHGPKACEAWCLQNNIHWKIANKIVLPPSSWPGLINGKFEIVFADECQHAKNIEANQWNTIHWLKPRFIVLSSATPLYAGINDMQAYLLLMEPSASVKDWQRKPTDSPYRPGLDSPYNLPEDHSAVVHRLYRSSFEKFVLSTPDPDRKGVFLRSIWRECLIMRTYSSTCPRNSTHPSTMIGGALPRLIKRTVEVQLPERADVVYFEESLFYLKKLMVPRVGPNGDEGIAYNANSWRALTFLSAAPLLVYSPRAMIQLPDIPQRDSEGNIMKDTYGKILMEKQIRKLASNWSKEKNVFRTCLKEIKTSRAFAKHLESGLFKDWAQSDIDKMAFQNLVWLFVRDSPKLALLLGNLADEVIKKQEKSIIWTMYPEEQLLLRDILTGFGLDARILSSDLSSAERVDMCTAFNRPGKLEVLIASYFANGAGLNLQKQCRNVHLWDPPPSAMTERQAIGRCYRMGQEREVLVTSYHTADTFNSYVANHQVLAQLPGLAAMFDTELAGLGTSDASTSPDAILANESNLFTFVESPEAGSVPKILVGEKLDHPEYADNPHAHTMSLQLLLIRLRALMDGKRVRRAGGLGEEFNVSEFPIYKHRLPPPKSTPTKKGKKTGSPTKRKRTTPSPPGSISSGNSISSPSGKRPRINMTSTYGVESSYYDDVEDDNSPLVEAESMDLDQNVGTTATNPVVAKRDRLGRLLHTVGPTPTPRKPKPDPEDPDEVKTMRINEIKAKYGLKWVKVEQDRRAIEGQPTYTPRSNPKQAATTRTTTQHGSRRKPNMDIGSMVEPETEDGESNDVTMGSAA